jgi:5'-3' exonuclease
MATSATFTVRSDLPCILVDASYYVFYRFYDSLKHQKPDGDNLHESPYFLKRVYYDMNADLCEMIRAWRTVVSNIIFCRDCSRATIWRNDHITEYKTHRPMKGTFNPQMFSVVSQYCKDRRIQEMAVERLEADDIIALTKKRLRASGFQAPIIIITNDNDYLQLLDEHTHAFNMNPSHNNLRERSLGDPKLDLRVKLIMGDRSDNIPPIQPNIGPKKALKLAQMSDAEFQDFLEKNHCRDAYSHNSQLIDMDAIRADLKESYDESVQIQLFYPKYNVY